MGLSNIDPDELMRPAVAVRIDGRDKASTLPLQSYRRAQLILTLHGFVSCAAPRGLWIIPPRCGMWIPANTPRTARISADGAICLLFVDPGLVKLPEVCCTLKVSQLLREIVQRLAELSPHYESDGPAGRLVGVLLDELSQAPTKQLHLPMSNDARLRRIAEALLSNPSDRGTMAVWAKRVAVSERTLARLILTETGMTFGRWRQQFHVLTALQRLSAGRPVQGVAEDLGYDSVSAFITMFKKTIGKSPGRYFAERGEMLQA